MSLIIWAPTVCMYVSMCVTWCMEMGMFVCVYVYVVSIYVFYTKKNVSSTVCSGSECIVLLHKSTIK